MEPARTPAQQAQTHIPRHTANVRVPAQWLRASDACLSLIEHFEGLRLQAYWDAHARVWTIGWGHTGPDVTRGQVITMDEARALLAQDVRASEAIVRRACVEVALTGAQFSALVSFVFNVGPGKAGVKSGFVVLKNGQPSTLLQKLRAGDVRGAADEFPKWVHAGGVRLPGLARRRHAERELFLNGRWAAS